MNVRYAWKISQPIALNVVETIYIKSAMLNVYMCGESVQCVEMNQKLKCV